MDWSTDVKKDWSKKNERNIKLIEGKSMKKQKKQKMNRRRKKESRWIEKNEVKVKTIEKKR